MTIICIRNVSDVGIADLGISGFNQTFLGQAETAVNIFEASNLRITGTHITNVVEGIIGEAVGNILLRDNDIPFPADAIVLTMAAVAPGGDLPLPLASIVGNRADGGRVTVFSQGSVHLLGNIIGGELTNEWEGKLHASGNHRRRFRHHHSAPEPAAAWSRACSRSAIRSSAVSMPMERRSRSRGVGVDGPSMLARCSIMLSTPPSEVARLNTFTCAAVAIAAGSPCRCLKDSIPP